MAKKECTCGYSIGHPLVPKCTCKPTEWVGLTYEDMIKVWNETYKGGDVLPTTFALAIEKKLKEKNT